ncbi:MAG: hypothetical protein H0W16_06315, partial [Actinobacteria bacterium]|nr:hypothetical protein [Actinomycetota bacterium]
SGVLDRLDRLDELGALIQPALELARRRGDREWEQVFTGMTIEAYVREGRWVEALDLEQPDISVAGAALPLGECLWERGQPVDARNLVDRVAMSEDTSDFQWEWCHSAKNRILAQLDDRPEEALRIAIDSFVVITRFRLYDLMVAGEVSAIARLAGDVGDRSPAVEANRTVGALLADRATRHLTAQHERLAGVLAAAEGDHDEATTTSRSGSPPLETWASSLSTKPRSSSTTRARWSPRAARKRSRPLLAEARVFYEGAGAARVLERIAQLEASAAGAELHAS